MSAEDQTESDESTADSPTDTNGSAEADDRTAAPETGPDTPKSRRGAAVLAIFLGGIGGHKFYLGHVEQGLLYLCFAWTLVPALVGIVEGVRYLRLSDEAFQGQYGG